MERDDLRRWVSEYERIWRADAVSELDRLFADDALYLTAPFAEPFHGLAAIAAMWPEEAGAAFTVGFELVAVEGDVGVVRADVHYEAPRERALSTCGSSRSAPTGAAPRSRSGRSGRPGARGASTRARNGVAENAPG
jgi:SnoaL-like domain